MTHLLRLLTEKRLRLLTNLAVKAGELWLTTKVLNRFLYVEMEFLTAESPSPSSCAWQALAAGRGALGPLGHLVSMVRPDTLMSKFL